MPEEINDIEKKSLAELLRSGIQKLGLMVTSQQEQQLLDFVFLLKKWNQSYNLTAIRDLSQMIIRHLLDSLAVSPYLLGSSIMDVGTGAGLPGIPFAITNPEKNFTLIDSNGKKIRFLTQVKIELKLNNIVIIQSRVEDFHPSEKFSTIISRAFRSIDEVVKVAGNLLIEQGLILVMQGKYQKQQLTSLPKPWQIVDAVSLTIPGLAEERHVVMIKNLP